MKIRRGSLAGAAIGAGALALIAGCSSVQPSIGQYGIVTGQGSFSNQQVKDVVDPGAHIKVSGSDTEWYLPANTRNYVTQQGNGGDRSNPQAELTGSAGGSPGMSDYTYTYLAFELNPNHGVLGAFFPFCLKYGCASQTAQTNSSNESAAHSSTPGWNAMLAEIMPHAIDNATQEIITKYGPDLWTNRSEWGAYGDQIAAALPAEIAKLTGSSVPYFCGPGSTAARCAPFTVLVNNVTPTDPGVVSAYNQQVSSAYSAQAGKARLNAAKEVYGSDANWFLGVTDLINDCQARHVTCNLYVGNAPVHP
jgi:hypothetical protein